MRRALSGFTARPRGRGFTLIETMTVLAIGSIMTTLAVVGLQQTIAASSETRASRSVAQLLKRGRTMALARHARVGVRIDLALHGFVTTTCAQRFGEARCVGNTIFTTDGPPLALRDDFAGVRVDVSGIDDDDHVITFNADGRPAGVARFVFDHPLTPGAQEVVVSVAGDVRVQATDAEVTLDES